MKLNEQSSEKEIRPKSMYNRTKFVNTLFNYERANTAVKKDNDKFKYKEYMNPKLYFKAATSFFMKDLSNIMIENSDNTIHSI